MPTIRVGDVTTHYDLRGEGPAIVFVHGAVVDAGQWRHQMAAFSDDYTTVAYDVRGHGRTGGSAREAYSIDLFAEDLAALVEGLGLDRPVVCGHSMGGCIAQVYAAEYPDRLGGLVLADTFTPRLLKRRDRLQWALLRAAIPLVRLFGYPRIERMLVWIQERIAGSEAGGDYGSVQRLREDAPPMATDEFAKVLRALLGFLGRELDYTAITVPTLVLSGEHDPAFVRRHAPVLADAIDGATLREIPGAGHASNLDAPDAFDGALRAFLDGLPLTDPASG